MMKAISLAAFAAFMASSAFAANSFYVGHPAKSKNCMVTQVKPDGKMMMQVGKAHSSRTLAESAIKSSSACTH